MLAERSAVRLGDAEREAAASALGDHLVAGRLTIAEYEERVGRVWAARFTGELAELFADLPVQMPTASVSRRRGPRPFVLAPVLFAIAAVLMIVAVVNILPWVFLLVLGMFMFSHGRRRRYRYAHYHGQWGHYPRRIRAISV